ncbi:hypothetical protein TR75_10170 [Hydrogenibacillus schlegelii]|uniref:hypothetical protein n=1 Tax=Hydrogenibacillus schlegelii TaxID=1484 RepID=UPI000795D91F|nr:hypothetical protein [Hydrogenibacillus schlegelii]KWW97156.1 hypothetical protein TR75_10170 [Hydrogenibacillus schlegelii]
MMKRWKWVMTIASLAFVLPACSTLSDRVGPSHDQATQTEAEQGSQAEPQAGTAENRPDKENRSATAPTKKPPSKGKRQFPYTLDLDLQKSHPNGSTVTLHKLTADEKYIKIEFEAVQSAGTTLLSRSWNDVKYKPSLIDDTGFAYKYIDPAKNQDLRIDRGQMLSGTLVFYGKLKDEAKTLTLTFNKEYEYEKDSNSTWNPYYQFTIDLSN